MDDPRYIYLHEEAIACAAATLDAIRRGNYFGTTPSDPDARDLHNHGCWLLAMLTDHLSELQAQIDALSDSQKQEG